MTPDERSYVVGLLETSRDSFLAAVRAVPDTQWGAQPQGGVWSPGEVAAHVLLSERLIFAAIRRALSAPPNPDWETVTAGKTALIERVVPERLSKVTAPDRLLPQLLAREELLRDFETARGRTLEFAQTTTVNLREHTALHPMPVFGMLNAYQWLLYIPLHNLRHTAQMVAKD